MQHRVEVEHSVLEGLLLSEDLEAGSLQECCKGRADAYQHHGDAQLLHLAHHAVHRTQHLLGRERLCPARGFAHAIDEVSENDAQQRLGQAVPNCPQASDDQHDDFDEVHHGEKLAQRGSWDLVLGHLHLLRLDFGFDLDHLIVGIICNRIARHPPRALKREHCQKGLGLHTDFEHLTHGTQAHHAVRSQRSEMSSPTCGWRVWRIRFRLSQLGQALICRARCLGSNGP